MELDAKSWNANGKWSRWRMIAEGVAGELGGVHRNPEWVPHFEVTHMHSHTHTTSARARTCMCGEQGGNAREDECGHTNHGKQCRHAVFILQRTPFVAARTHSLARASALPMRSPAAPLHEHPCIQA